MEGSAQKCAPERAAGVTAVTARSAQRRAADPRTAALGFVADFFSGMRYLLRVNEQAPQSQIERRCQMIRKRIAMLSLMTLLVVATAFAERPLKATIPFDFTVGSTQMSAGEYTVTFDIPGLVRITRDDQKTSCAILTMAVQARKVPQAGALVFNKYGDAHFLSRIWSPGYDQGRELRKSKTELEIAKNVAAVQVASVAATQR
jgi:hypothetical protein